MSEDKCEIIIRNKPYYQNISIYESDLISWMKKSMIFWELDASSIKKNLK